MGKHNFLWDGINDQGLPVPDGTYSIRINAFDADSEPLESATTVVSTVTGVAAEDGIIVLKFGDDITVPLANVVSVAGAAGQNSQNQNNNTGP